MDSTVVKGKDYTSPKVSFCVIADDDVIRTSSIFDSTRPDYSGEWDIFDI